MTGNHQLNYVKILDDAIQKWQQGDCVIGEKWFVYRIDIDRPLTPAAITASEENVDLAEIAVKGFTVITQTCDIVRSCSDRSFFEEAPLVEVDRGELNTIKKGRRPRYAFIPGLFEHGLVADLDRVMTIEKSVVAKWERIPGCGTDNEFRALSSAMNRKRTRFAFPDDFTLFSRKLQSRLQEKHDKQSDEGRALRALREIRVKAAPSWYENEIELTFWFIREDNESNFEGKTWDSQLDGWFKLIFPSGRFKKVDGLVITLDDLTARDYIESDLLDLDYLSVRVV